MNPIVPNPTNLEEWRDDEYDMYFNEFEPLDKVDFYKKTSDMMCKDIVKSMKIEKDL